MPTTPPTAPDVSPLRAIGLALGALALGLSGCSGNPTCVFVGGCQGGAGGPAGPPATFPVGGLWIVDGAPTIERTLPTGFGVASTTPIVIVFSESIASGTLLGGGVEVVPLDFSGFPLPPVPVTEALVGDGRVLVLLPQILPPSDYVVQLAEDAEITDVTGQLLTLGGGAQLANFSVDVTDPDTPAVVDVWPPDAATGQSTVGEIVVAFDRAMDPTTVTDASFDVTVGGVAPTDDPVAQPFSAVVGGFPIQDTRLYLYRSVDATGDPTSLGTSASVVLNLSPVGNEISDIAGGMDLPALSRSFTTVALEPVSDSTLLSNPTDAIGIANLTPGDPEELALQVDLVDGEPGDALDLFLFGTSTDDEDPQTVALLRTITLAGAAPITAVPVTLADVDLTSSGVPRFADGDLAFAWRMRRGADVTVLQVLDVDAVTDGIQDALLDTTAPVVTSLLRSGAAATDFLTDLRDLTFSGTASEPLSSVFVTTDVGDNGVGTPRVMGTDANGLFIAAPVPAGLVAPGTINYTLTAYDFAGNASAPFTGTVLQLGTVRGAALPLGGSLAVDAFDAETLQPIGGAIVTTHADLNDGINYPLVDSGTTDVAGEATLTAAGAGAIATILSIDAPGYDLFTLHGVASDDVSIPLWPSDTGANAATVSGAITSSSALADLTLTLVPRKLADSRRPEFADPTYDGDACSSGGPFGGGTGLSCPYGPEDVRAERIGAQSFLAGNFGADELTFTAVGLLQAFDLLIPVPPTPLDTADVTAIDVGFLLSEPTAPPNELPVEIASTALSGALTTGIDLLSLDDDPVTTGEPRITVETTVPGVYGSVPVGLGLAFDQGGSVWVVRAAVPGAVTDPGFFGGLSDAAIVDTDHLLRAELRDTTGNVAGVRPHVSELPGLPVPNTLFPGNVAQVIAPTPGGSTGGTSFDVTFDNAILDAQGEPGLYRVTLTDPDGRRWHLWREDLPDAVGDMLVHVPDLTLAGGSTLTSGGLVCTISSWAWPGFDATSFLWTDVEREHDVFSHSAGVTFTQP